MQNKPKTHEREPGAVTHPNREAWMAYLYGELPQQTRAEAADHLGACPECQAKVAVWRATMKSLDEWPLAKSQPQFHVIQPLLKWGIAALLMVAVSYGVGRLSAASAIHGKALRTEIANTVKSSVDAELRQKIRQEFIPDLQAAAAAAHSQFANDLGQLRTDLSALVATTASDLTGDMQRLLAVYETKSIKNYQTLVTALQELDSKQTTDYASLRKELETVAVLTQDSFVRAQQQIVQLADYTQPAK